MAATERWVPTLGYELALIGGVYHVLKRGGIHVKDRIPNEEVSLRPFVVATDYGDAVMVLRALRANLSGSPAETGVDADA